MKQFFDSFRRLIRRGRRSGARITYEITVEKDGEKRTMRSEDHARKEAASGQADGF